MADIFISYARENADMAKVLADYLIEQNYTVWWDRNLLPGQQVNQAISQEIDNSRCVIVIWTKESISSSWVNDEADQANYVKKLIPIKADELDARELPLGTRSLHTINFSQLDDIPKILSKYQISACTEPENASTIGGLTQAKRKIKKLRTYGGFVTVSLTTLLMILFPAAFSLILLGAAAASIFIFSFSE